MVYILHSTQKCLISTKLHKLELQGQLILAVKIFKQTVKVESINEWYCYHEATSVVIFNETQLPIFYIQGTWVIQLDNIVT